MAKQYLFRVELLNKKNYNPLEVVAFYSGNTFYNVLNNKTYESQNKEKVLWSHLIIPNEKHILHQQLPTYLQIKSSKKDTELNARNILWKELDARENRVDSQFGRLFELAIPYFFSDETAKALVFQFSETLINSGMIVDASLHQANKAKTVNILDNILGGKEEEKTVNHVDYACYLICTLRNYQEGRFANKNRDWNTPEQLKYWRTEWLSTLNSFLLKHDNVEERQSWQEKLTIYPEYRVAPTLQKMKM